MVNYVISKETLDQLAHLFFLDATTFGTIVLLPFIVINVILSQYFKRFKIQSQTQNLRQIISDLLYSLLTVFIISIVQYLTVGLEPFAFDRHVWNPFPGFWILTTLGLIVAHDSYFYLTHRLFHLPFFYRHFHHIHHQTTNPTALTILRFHPIESASLTIFYLAAMALPISREAILVFTFFGNLANSSGHCGYEFVPEHVAKKSWFRFFMRAKYHNFHHQKPNVNYGIYFTWWDHWSGSLRSEMKN